MSASVVDSTSRRGDGARPQGLMKRWLSGRRSRDGDQKRNRMGDGGPPIPDLPQGTGVSVPAVLPESSINKALADSGDMLSEVLSNQSGYHAVVEAGASTKPSASEIPTDAPSMKSDPPSLGSSLNATEPSTGITTPMEDSTPSTRAYAESSSMARDASVFDTDRRPTITRTRTVTVDSQPIETVGKGTAAESSLMDATALSRVADPTSTVAGIADLPEISKTQTAPAPELSEKAKGKQKAVDDPRADSSALSKIRSAPAPASTAAQWPSSDQKQAKPPASQPEPVAQKKSSGLLSKLFSFSNKKNLVQYPVSNGVQHVGGLTANGADIKNKSASNPLVPGHSKWAESTWEEKLKERRRLVSDISSYNLINAMKYRTQPAPERVSIGPLDETWEFISPFEDDPAPRDFVDGIQMPSSPIDESAMNAVTSSSAGGVSSRMTSCFPMTLEDLSEEEQSSECSAPVSSVDTDPDLGGHHPSGAKNERKGKDSTRPSLAKTGSSKFSLRRLSLARQRTDADTMSSVLVKAASMEKCLRKDTGTRSGHDEACGDARLTRYRSHSKNNKFQELSLERCRADDDAASMSLNRTVGLAG